MIRFDHVTFTYPDATTPTLVDVDFVVPEGELCLVVGETGSGKSTLLRMVNGLVPRFSGGLLTGTVTVGGRSTAVVPPRELADVIGFVGQDPAAAEEVLAALTRLVHDLGITVLVAEHRLERVVQYADTMVFVPGHGEPVVFGDPRRILADSPVVPPVVELGRLAGWSPLPLSVRDARRAAAELRSRLAPLVPPTAAVPASGALVAEVTRLHARYGPVTALDGVDLEVRAGEVVALMGRNGAGKSTLLSHLVGLRRPMAGEVRVLGQEPHRLPARAIIRTAGLVPQDNGVLLYHDTVAAECVAADRDADLAAGTTRAVLDRLVPGIDQRAHPRDLSEGQRLALVLAIVLGSEPALVLLDEPTRGLDYAAKQRLIAMIEMLAAEGRAVVLATHDVEVVAAVAHRAVVLADGEIVADGPARDVVVHSPVFAPQVAKVLAPDAWLTVAEIRGALDSTSADTHGDSDR